MLKIDRKMSKKYTYTQSSIPYSGFALSIRDISMLQALEILRKATVIHKTFERGSRFRVQQHNAGKIEYLFFRFLFY